MNLYYLERTIYYQDVNEEIELELTEPLAYFDQLDEALEYNKFLIETEDNFNVSYQVVRKSK